VLFQKDQLWIQNHDSDSFINADFPQPLQFLMEAGANALLAGVLDGNSNRDGRANHVVVAQ